MPIPEDERVNDERLNGERSDPEGVDDQRIIEQRIVEQRIAGQRINDPSINDLFIDDPVINDPPIDEKFEARLKQFRPLAPGPLPVNGHVRTSRHWFVPAVWAATAAAIVVVAVLAFHARPGRVAPPVQSAAIADLLAKPRSLTIGTANALLASAPSFKDAIDGIAFPPKPAPLPADKHSALTELSKEKIKL